MNLSLLMVNIIKAYQVNHLFCLVELVFKKLSMTVFDSVLIFKQVFF